MRKVLILITFIALGFQAKAEGPFKHWAIGFETGSYGFGPTLATSLSPYVKLKAAFDYANVGIDPNYDLSINTGYQIDGTLVDNLNLSGIISDLSLKMANFKLGLDLYPRQNGIFSVSAGAYLGNTKATTQAKISGYNENNISSFEFEGIVIKPNQDGSFDADVNWKTTVKPYFSIGLGRTIANSRVGFKFDLGVIYQGEYTLESKNASNQNLNLIEKSNEYLNPTYFKFWPLINFSLSYRIF